jgi:bla regulator protein BlaR1
MTGEYFSSSWASVAPGVADHLWQSTLFAIAASLLTLLLRKQNARARHWLWLAASLKFLFPFSLLVSIGSLLSPAPADAPSIGPVVYFAMEEIAQPFSQLSVRVTPAHASSIASSILPQLSQMIVAVWLVGFLAVLVVWAVRWRRISLALRHAVHLSEGREVEALRRMERIGGIRRPIKMMLSPASLEPGVFGIARPVLVWPDGISQHLNDPHLEAVLAHEVWHVSRRDNLFAALHMLVEAIFWFYPLVWWLGARLVDERERACDEEVVALGNDRQIYAESILRVCEFCLGSPLPCVSGVTGADLKRRMVHIMNHRIPHKLDFARKALLTLAALLAIAVPITFGLLNATPSRAQSQAANATLPSPMYSSVSIKPSKPAAGELYRAKMMVNLSDGSFTASDITLQRLIQLAYHIQDSLIVGGPDWVNTEKFDINAKLDPSVVAAMHKQMAENNSGDLKVLLADKFKLAVHSENRVLPAYDLVVDSGDHKLQEVDGIRVMHMEPGHLISQGTPIDHFAAQLSLRLGRPIVDKTGLKASYAFNLHWTPASDELERLKQGGEEQAMPQTADPNGPSLFTALQEQLGLKLEPHTESVQMLVIDHAEVPSEN